MSKIFFILLCLISTANAEPWATTDKYLMGSYVALQAIDCLQTEKALDKGMKEANPFYGDNPSTETLVVTKGALIGITYFVADQYPQDRRWMLWSLNIIQGIVVAHNYTLVKFGFPLRD